MISSTAERESTQMIITFNTHYERTAADYALGCAEDNEHDKGDEGCGEEILTYVSEFHRRLWDSKPGQPVLISFTVAGILMQYLYAIEGTESFEDEEDPAQVEAARSALLERIERFSITAVI
jgi:hypothetical protein